MRISKLSVTKLTLLTTDLLMLALAFVLGNILRLHEVGGLEQLTAWWQADGNFRVRAFGLAALLGMLRYAVSLSHYSIRRPYWDELRNTLMTLLAMMLIEAAIMFMTQWPFSRSAFLLTWAAAFVLVPTGRVLAKKTMMRLGIWQREIVLIGDDQSTIAAWKALRSDKLLGYKLACVVSSSPRPHGAWQDATQQYISFDSAGQWLGATQGRLVIVALDSQPGSNFCDTVIRQLSATQSEYLVIPSSTGLPMYGLEVQHMFSHDTLILHAFNRSAQLPARITKRLFDIAGSASLLLLLSPALLWLAWRVSQSGRPIIFSHSRVGMSRKPIPCLKFRTMVPNAQEVLQELLASDPAAREEWEREFKLKNDPRITDIGHFLRRSSLDELPQLWSVLKGDMSLVGPRPVITEELDKYYGANAEYYAQVRPGMTGLWQVSGRNDVDYATRVALDVWYVRNWSLWYDIAILFKTISVVLKRDGAY